MIWLLLFFRKLHEITLLCITRYHGGIFTESKEKILYISGFTHSLCIFFSELKPWEDSAADSDVAEQTGRLSALSTSWKQEHESTFLDSDWPSFSNAVYSLSLSLSLSPSLSCFSASQAVDRPNQSNVTAKLMSKFCSGRSLVLAEQLTVAHLHVDGLPIWPLQAGFGWGKCIYPNSPSPSLLSSLYFSCFNSIFRTGACWDGKPACRLILWHKGHCRTKKAHDNGISSLSLFSLQEKTHKCEAEEVWKSGLEVKRNEQCSE